MDGIKFIELEPTLLKEPDPQPDINDIPGWFNFASIYMTQVYNVKNQAHFVEVGAWLGKSTAWMAGLIKNTGKNIKFDVVDTWEGQNDQSEQMETIELLKGANVNLFDGFKAWMTKFGVLEYINPIKMTSVEASKLYADESLDFVFIDADHRYEAILQDLNAWWSKIKPGKVFAGHDYDWPDVKRAVDEFFNERQVKVIQDATSWKVKKPE